MSNNAHELSKRLLNALDSSYNVVDMHTVNEIISVLEKINITKELLETTRLGKHVNELRRRTSDPTLARRAKVLVKRWRDLVIPNAVASPAHTGSNRSSAERQTRGARLGGTPLTSPALSLSRQVLSPVVISPRPVSRPAWGGYESDSQDVILVDDDPPTPVPTVQRPQTPSKRPLSPAPTSDEKKAKRDKKPKKRRGHSRAGSGTETAPDDAAAGAWAARNGVSPPAPASTHVPAPAPSVPAAPSSTAPTPHSRRNGCAQWRRGATDAYAALVNRIPPVGVKKVRTTKELLEEIQSRGAKPASPASPHSPDVMVIEPDPCPVKVDSPLRNGSGEPAAPSPVPALAPPSPCLPLEEERPHEECTCGESADDTCPAAQRTPLVPRHVHALHHALLPGVNGTRAPLHPHRFAVRPAVDPDNPGLFATVVPLYKYSDYADDYCIKNLARVPLAAHLPWTEFAPPPPAPPTPPAPPSPRPYPTLSIAPSDRTPDDSADEDNKSPALGVTSFTENPPEVRVKVEPSDLPDECDRLKPPPVDAEDDARSASPTATSATDTKSEPRVSDFQSDAPDHRTVERAKRPLMPPSDSNSPTESLDGRTLYAVWRQARATARYGYERAGAAPVLTLHGEAAADDGALAAALDASVEDAPRDAFGRPGRHAHFSEWHECARLGDLVALPYVVID